MLVLGPVRATVNSMNVNEWIGAQFHRLTVVGAGKKYKNGTQLLRCVCSCGGTAETSLPHLKRGEVKSCGCLNQERVQSQKGVWKVDLTGQKFGRLTVLQAAGQTKNGAFRWKCQCTCGQSKVVTGYSLQRGTTKSCGCLASEIVRKRNNASRKDRPWRVEMTSTRSQARYRKISFDLTVTDFQTLVTASCHYCGKKPGVPAKAVVLREAGVLVGGIDRKDSSLGYTLENCVPCCGTCNVAKLHRPYDDFINDIKRRYEHLKNKGIL